MTEESKYWIKFEEEMFYCNFTFLSTLPWLYVTYLGLEIKNINQPQTWHLCVILLAIEGSNQTIPLNLG
jgi:hypothetical protein